MENRKQEIIEVALKLIKKYGYDSFSYKDLSEIIGITKATLHHHYPKKEQLGVAVCEQLVRNGFSMYKESLGYDDARERLNYWIDALLLEVDEEANCPISSLQSQINSIPDSMANILIEINRAERKSIIDTLILGIEQGYFLVEDVEGTAELILYAIKGAVLYQLASKESHKEKVKEVIFSILDKS
ncbi:TetR/AcrR family transcriptional regulator [Vallitalea okinawensis]|uniref:TetR/AcrR family transcriptional regulator n=1 Tax=Vallitalea okinawensis TaxID=2078660 RepID=UPI000CFAC94C|nr:TetR/AcrR family transcriptional regulator [Vallitalea okinawensis]